MAKEIADFSGLFDAIGSIKKDLIEAENSPLVSFMTNVAMQLVSRLKASILNEMGSDTNLSQSVAPSVRVEGGVIKVEITANDYWSFINEGVSGVENKYNTPYSFKTIYPNKKMALSLQDYMGRRGISNAEELESASYAMAVSVKKHGIKPTHFVDKVLNEKFLEEIAQGLTDELGKTVSLSIK